MALNLTANKTIHEREGSVGDRLGKIRVQQKGTD